MSACVILVAAGHGRRFGSLSQSSRDGASAKRPFPSPSQRPKQFKPLRGKPLLYWPLRTFQRMASVRDVVLVVSRDYLGWARAFVRRERLTKIRSVVEGGAERADSVRSGFRALPPEADVVLVHDAARALVSPDVVERVIAASRRTGVALAAWPVPDTVKLARAGRRPRVKRTVPRERLWLAQTPQGFRRDVADRVFRARNRRVTDDVQWAERAGKPVELVLGSPRNFKVTVPEDFRICEMLLRDGENER